jgi:4-carboxymuconolactone decarboxylase
MESLTTAEQELVALGAALGSNCVPCIEYHIPQARAAGLSDRQIGAAVRLADTVRQVPARKVLAVAAGLLRDTGADNEAVTGASACAQQRRAPNIAAASRCCD